MRKNCVKKNYISSFFVLGYFFFIKKINLNERTNYMENNSNISSKIIEIEISIKLLEYLKRKNTIDDGIYKFCINKLVNKINLEKNQSNDNYILII